MENRERDKMSKNTGSTSAGDVNRNTSSQPGKVNDSSADFGQKIGRAEKRTDSNSSESGSSYDEPSSKKTSSSMGSNAEKNDRSENSSTFGNRH